MLNLWIKVLIIASLSSSSIANLDTYDKVAPFIRFIIIKENYQKYLITNTTTDAAFANQVCTSTEPITWILHGWQEGFLLNTEWINPMVNNFLSARGGCVILMEYSYYSQYPRPYTDVAYRYFWLRDIFVNALKMFGNYERMFVFGFSFGSRIAIGAGAVLTGQNRGIPQLPNLHLCDPAGPEFDYITLRYIPATNAALNVQCIGTSNDYGTKIYDCHQNFKMGRCGKRQDCATVPPKLSHGMCPHLYNLAFTNVYKYSNIFNAECLAPLRMVNQTCLGSMRMGFFNTMNCVGDIPVPTAKCYPFVVNGNVWWNMPTSGICPTWKY